MISQNGKRDSAESVDAEAFRARIDTRREIIGVDGIIGNGNGVRSVGMFTISWGSCAKC